MVAAGRESNGRGLLLVALAAAARGANAGDACECLNWKQIYDSGRATCGMGAEMFWRTRKLMASTYERLDLSSFFKEVCYTGFWVMDTNRCATLQYRGDNTEDYEGERWCYVSEDCKDLNGGTQVVSQGLLWSSKTDLSIKICRPGVDAFLSEWGPLEIYDIAKKWAAHARYYVHLGTLMRLAYPWLRPWWGNHWEDIMYRKWPNLDEPVKKAIVLGSGMLMHTQEDGRGGMILVHGNNTLFLKEDDDKCPDTFQCLQCIHCSEKYAKLDEYQEKRIGREDTEQPYGHDFRNHVPKTQKEFIEHYGEEKGNAEWAAAEIFQ